MPSTSTHADWPANACWTRSLCRAAWAPAAELGVHPVGQTGVLCDEQARRQLVVLGLGDQVRGEIGRIGGAVGDDRDLGRAVFPVGANDAAQHPLRGGDVDVARPGDDVGSRAIARAVAEHRQRLGAADRMHLTDAEQRAGREHDGVGQAAVVRLRRRRDRDGFHPGGLGRDDVHHYGRGIGDQPAGHVDAGRPTGTNRVMTERPGAGELQVERGRHLRFVHEPDPPGCLFKRGPHSGVERGERVIENLGRDPGCGQVHAVELSGVLAHRLRAPGPDRFADRSDERHRRLDVEQRPRQHVGERGPG